MWFMIKQHLKMFMQGLVLPAVYCLYKYSPIRDNRVIFADAHHNALPYSMQEMHRTMADMGFEIIDYFNDYGNMSIPARLYSMVCFMRLYATAKYVFICDYYLPVSSCKKKAETVVVQLWHCGGILKKMGFDAPDDIPSCYKLNPHKNYSLMTVSSACCVPVFTSALHLPEGIVRDMGTSRSDVHFDSSFARKCKEAFFGQYPEAHGKKIVLWAPTFRGNASAPFLVGEEDILKLQEKLGQDWIVLIKAHPYIDRQHMTSNCMISSEELLPVTDILITDYSTVLFDYLIYEKPFVLFAPDYEIYERERGFYIDYYSLPGEVVTKGDKLALAVERASRNTDRGRLKKCRDTYMGKCDGNSTKRIISFVTNLGRPTYHKK